jgi:CelD/BcsL family acetyltransferase involved in cellulose biosynthesis
MYFNAVLQTTFHKGNIKRSSMHINCTIQTVSANDEKTFKQLATEWQVLQAQAECDFFMSWHWIGNWLAQAPKNYYVLKATQDGFIVGLAVLFINKAIKMKCIPVTELWLNKTGQPLLDQIWIEYNDFLTRVSDRDDIRKAMLMAIAEQHKNWQQFNIGLSEENVITQTAETLNLAQTNITVSKGYKVNIESLHETSSDYSTVLSKNTLRQIKRSESLLREQGELVFQIARDHSTKKQYFNEISVLHIKKWQETEDGSGFSNPKFVEFHRSLLFKPSSCEHTELCQLSLNSKPLGYLYNFRWQGTTYFYLSALEKFADNRIKVGLLLHYMMIKVCIERGDISYDFLCGDARYKNSLSNTLYTQTIASFTRPGIITTAFKLLRGIKSRLFINPNID